MQEMVSYDVLTIPRVSSGRLRSCQSASSPLSNSGVLTESLSQSKRASASIQISLIPSISGPCSMTSASPSVRGSRPPPEVLALCLPSDQTGATACAPRLPVTAAISMNCVTAPPFSFATRHQTDAEFDSIAARAPGLTGNTRQHLSRRRRRLARPFAFRRSPAGVFTSMSNHYAGWRALAGEISLRVTSGLFGFQTIENLSEHGSALGNRARLPRRLAQNLKSRTPSENRFHPNISLLHQSPFALTRQPWPLAQSYVALSARRTEETAHLPTRRRG